MTDWAYIQEHWDWLGHIVEALAMAGIVACLMAWLHGWRLALLFGLIFAVGHFHGREKRDYEISMLMQPPHLEGYLIWRWGWDQATDFWPVLIIACAIGAIVHRSRW